MPQQSDLLAVLVDADNVSPSRIGGVLAEIATYGTASVKRIYGDWTKSQLRGWKDAASEHVIQPMQQFDNTTGKNATDSALIIDAMDLLYTRRFQGFCIVSSDSDFTRLASRIREEGVTVYGFGERKTPEAFRNACDQFTYLEVLGVIDEPDAARSTTSARWTTAALRGDARLVALLRSAVETASADDGWSDLGTVGQLMRKQQPDFDPRNWGYAKLSDLLKAVGLFAIESKPGGMSIRPKAAKGGKGAGEVRTTDAAEAAAPTAAVDGPEAADEAAPAAGTGRSRRKPARGQGASSAPASGETPAADAAGPGDGRRADDEGGASARSESGTVTAGGSGRSRRPMIEQLTLGAALDAALDAVSTAARANDRAADPGDVSSEREPSDVAAAAASEVARPAETPEAAASGDRRGAADASGDTGGAAPEAEAEAAADEAPSAGRGAKKAAAPKKARAPRRASAGSTADAAPADADGGGPAPDVSELASGDGPVRAATGRGAGRARSARKTAVALESAEASTTAPAAGAAVADVSAGGDAAAPTERPKRAPRSRAAKAVTAEATAEPAPVAATPPADAEPGERPKRAPRRASRPGSVAG
ncbi:NYN domain-containing protein [Microbacterium sp. cf332]|uniref:NYN domain-containing protein n=1 Tax=Microbacterium sp. cf332 TaxID=1761804 RepID=UPI00088F982A|nr:NYN domain-containing protein [Microbacterium sp. cf332]SDQ22962.1 OST-HTH/LOTUS domain-containing protein [Microbacterium sp. cf332]